MNRAEDTVVETVTDRMKLAALRVAVAMVCQTFNVETADLPVLGKKIDELSRMAKTCDRGWTHLLVALEEKHDRENRCHGRSGVADTSVH